MAGVAAAQGVEADPVSREIQLAADQTIQPKRADLEGMAEEGHRAPVRRPADEDDHPFRLRLKVLMPRGRERPPLGRGVNPLSGLAAEGQDVALGTLLERRQGLVMKPGPDFGLPAPVKAFSKREPFHPSLASPQRFSQHSTALEVLALQ